MGNQNLWKVQKWYSKDFMYFNLIIFLLMWVHIASQILKLGQLYIDSIMDSLILTSCFCKCRWKIICNVLALKVNIRIILPDLQPGHESGSKMTSAFKKDLSISKNWLVLSLQECLLFCELFGHLKKCCLLAIKTRIY